MMNRHSCQETDRNISIEVSKTVSHTTRSPRSNEVNGVDYKFVSDKSQMLRDIKEDKFVEYAQVHDYLYGTSITSLKEILDQDKYVCVIVNEH
jgi:guanylate kinase